VRELQRDHFAAPDQSNDEVSSRLIVMAQDYKAKGNAVEAESKSPLTAMVIHSVSPDRETNQS
jgi:hypothetical protein